MNISPSQSAACDAGPCPCGMGEAYSRCCGVFHSGANPPTAVQLMRARYVAYARGDDDFVHRTWSAETRPSLGELATDAGTQIEWRRLVVETVEAGGPFDDHGRVQFTAIGRSSTGRVVLREDSRFVRRDGVWAYVDGVIREP